MYRNLVRRWHVTLVEQPGDKFVYKPGGTELTENEARTWAAERYIAGYGGRGRDSKIVDARIVHEHHPVAHELTHCNPPAEIEGGDLGRPATDPFDDEDEPDDPIWVHIGEHSIEVPADHVDRVLEALRVSIVSVQAERTTQRLRLL